MKTLFSSLLGLLLLASVASCTSEPTEKAGLPKNNSIELTTLTKKDTANKEIVIVSGTYWKDNKEAGKFTDTLNVSGVPPIYVSILQEDAKGAVKSTTTKK